MLSDIDIAQQATLQPIDTVAAGLGIPAEALEPYGRHKAKVVTDRMPGFADRPDGQLVLVTAISPTPAGEGKTTTSVGLADGLRRIGRKAAVCLREPSLGPVFGLKGGAAGGGHAQVVPMEDINLHFTGDFHAIAAAHNLLSALIDNHLHHGNALQIDSRRIHWKRVVDMNDRALRHINVGLGGPVHGVPREDGFDIVVASEVMAIFCLANSLADLKERLGAIEVARNLQGGPVHARDLQAHGAMTALLRDALRPNLVQTLEHTPAFVHGGPFANIAHGCNSVVATRTALKLADIVVTEAGFGADLGAEKFIDIKCRSAGLRPDAAVVVATVRALKYHGGAALDALSKEDLPALERGLANLERHLHNVRNVYGLRCVVALNAFDSDTEAEWALLQKAAQRLEVPLVRARHWADGGAGAEELARAVAALLDAPATGDALQCVYPLDLPLWDKIEAVAKRVYGAGSVTAPAAVRQRLSDFERAGHGRLPVCMAKTPASFSIDASLRGAPEGHVVAVREVRLSAGAGFVVVLCGDVMTMPGLPKLPAAGRIDVDAEGRITGLS